MKKELRYLLAGILISAGVFFLFSRVEMVAKVHADTGENKCVWSYIKDRGTPDIGESGDIKMDEKWSAMSKGGWKLKAVNSQDNIYVFEKCN